MYLLGLWWGVFFPSVPLERPSKGLTAGCERAGTAPREPGPGQGTGTLGRGFQRALSLVSGSNKHVYLLWAHMSSPEPPADKTRCKPSLEP